MYAYEINDDGFIINNYLIGGEVDLPKGCIRAQLPQPLLFHKPKWNSTQWVEGATQEEIDEITKPVPQPPTETDILKKEVSKLNATVLELTEFILGGN